MKKTKKCNTCQMRKPIKYFYNIKSYRCNTCHKAWRMLYYYFNREKTIKQVTYWQKNNKAKVYGYTKKWLKKSRAKYRLAWLMYSQMNEIYKRDA